MTPYRIVIEFDSREAFEEFLYEHDARIGRSCSDVMGEYRVVEPVPSAEAPPPAEPHTSGDSEPIDQGSQP